ncbi:MAG: hypothetical protein GIKADHBN_01824 [Phycisphaerales bacterium]|nr:hypothetical protein [Phycisphaerales bacterium]
MARMAVGVCAVVVGCVVASSAIADPVFSTGPADLVSGSGREMTAWVQADDFKLTADTMVTGASVQWFTLDRLRNWDRNVQWFVFADNAGAPGSVVATGGALNVLSTFEGRYSYDWYTTSFEFDTPVFVAAGAKYWFGLHFSSDYDRNDLYWADGTSTIMGSSQESLAGLFNNWTAPSGVDRAFQLVPAPGAIGGVGLGLVALARRRRSAI